MADSFNKKEQAKKKAKEKQDKAQKMQERKANNNKGKSLEDMMVYLDENGNFTTQPSTEKKQEIKLEDIQLGAAPVLPEDTRRSGVVKFFNEEKGYGFIVDNKTQEQVFVHQSESAQPLKEKDNVSFEKERTAKGYNAVNVTKL